MSKVILAIPNGHRSNIPLKTLSVGRGSVLDAEVHGAQEGLQSVEFRIERTDGTPGFWVVQATPMSDNRWAVYAKGCNFPNEGRVRYHLIGRDEKDGVVWIGYGTVNILPSSIGTEGTDAPLVLGDTYLRNPETGLWHKFTVVSENGDLVPEISKEGIER